MLTTALSVAGLVLLCGVLFSRYRRRSAAAKETLSGLASGDYFARYLQNCVARGTRHPSYLFGLLLIEIRGLPSVRRSIGRSATERILADFTERISWTIKATDVVSRIGDEQFAIILDDVSGITDVTRVAMHAHQSVAETAAASRDAKLDIAIGVTMNHPGMGLDANDLIAQAEDARRRAAYAGQPYVVFDEKLDEASRSELTLESELSLALEGGQFSLAFQPLVASDTRQLIGFTAFVQWSHPTRGLLRAREWIRLAESSPQMVKIGQWVVGAAVRTLRQLTDAAGRPMLLTVNVAPSEIERGELPQDFATALTGESALGPMLRIELPNAVFADPSPALTATAAKLHDLGVGIHIDHAAAGTVALWRSLQLGVRGVRINLSEIDATDAPVLDQLLAASRQIAEEVVVEGIESQEDDQVVRHLAPPVLAQGYQIARPMPLDQAIALARTSGTRPVTPARAL